MRKIWAWLIPFWCSVGLLLTLLGGVGWSQDNQTVTELFVAYPPEQHETTSDKIFLIGTAPPKGEVLVNGQAIQRNAAGHFAPSVPLQLGDNAITLTYGEQSIQRNITRKSNQPQLSKTPGFVNSSLEPQVNWVRSQNELLCFGALASANAEVNVTLGTQTIPLVQQASGAELPPNSAVLTEQNQPQRNPDVAIATYSGCTTASQTGDWGQPTYSLQLANQTVTETAPGTVQIREPLNLEIAEVTAEAGVARTGPSTDHSRLTPLPKGTQVTVTGKEGDWLRLSYGAWLKASETKLSAARAPLRATIRSVTARQLEDWTEIRFPLSTAVPISVQQGDRTFAITLYDTVAQTDTIKLSPDPVVNRLDWAQTTPTQITYTFHLHHLQQWGYKLRYEGSTLILSLKHPPQITAKSLKGAKILLDPGHGSENDLGARGPTGYPEKDVTLKLAKLLQPELEKRGATVVMTRYGDDDLWPQDRVEQIDRQEPTLALSLHYNALPDSGDALNTQGIGMFWYNPQAHHLATFLHNALTENLDRPSYGVFWNNLALTRPTVAPSILLELGFMINPDEFEWIMNPQAQKKLAVAIAQAVQDWFVQATEVS